MELAIVVAKVLSVYLVISGLFLIFRGKTLPILLKDFFEHPAVVHLSGIFLVFLGAALVVQNNVWELTWRTAVTVFGWLVLLKGVIYLFFPKLLAGFPVKKMRQWFVLFGIILIAAGVYLFRSI